MRAVDAELLHAIPAAFPPQRQPLGPAAESVTELCNGIAVSASRLRAAVHRGQDRVSWSPDVTSGGWQWMAQAAAVTTHLSELALCSLATRVGRLPSLPVTEAQLHGAADAMIGMRAAWQRVDLMWNTIITEQRLLPTLAMSEAGDLLLRMGWLVWDNPQWTPARAHRSPRRSPAALAPGKTAFTAVLSAAHQAADALARVAATDITTVQAAARAGRLYMPTRSLPEGYDVPVRSRPRWSAPSWICKTPTAVLPKQAPKQHVNWTRSPSRWRRPARPWPWHGRRQWPRPGDGAVKTPGPITTPATICHVPMCLSEIAAQLPGCPGPSSGP